MADCMMFPETFDEFVESFGFYDDRMCYTNGTYLISVFRVKQWLENESARQKAEFDLLKKYELLLFLTLRNSIFKDTDLTLAQSSVMAVKTMRAMLEMLNPESAGKLYSKAKELDDKC